MEDKVLRELPPLLDSDFMYVADRRKKEFTYPIHKHEVFELNYVENGEGVLRIVGDSAETIGNRELVLITSPDLEHVWEQDKCKSEDIREITVQFFFDFNSSYSLFNRTPCFLSSVCSRGHARAWRSHPRLLRRFIRFSTHSHLLKTNFIQ